MQLNQATDYAFRMVLHLACLPSGEIVNAHSIADQESIPQRFLLKIMRSLTKSGLINSYRGVDGGYALAKVPRDITLLDVITAMEGPVAIHHCLAERSACNKHCTHECPVHAALAGVQDQLVTALSTINFATLVAEKKGRNGRNERE